MTTRKKYSPSKDTCELPPDVELSTVDKRAISATLHHPFAENNILTKSIDGKDMGRIRTQVFGFIRQIGAKPKFGESIGKLFEFIQEKGPDITMDHRILDAYLKMFPKKFGCFDTSYFGKLFQGCKDTFADEEDTKYTNVINNKKAKIRYLMKYISIIMRKIMEAFVSAFNTKYKLEIRIPDQQRGGDGDSDIHFNSETYNFTKELVQFIGEKISKIPVSGYDRYDIPFYIATLLTGLGELIILLYLIFGVFMVIVASGIFTITAIIDIFNVLFYAPEVLNKLRTKIGKITRKMKERVGTYFEKKRMAKLPQVYTTTYIKEGVDPMADMPEGIQHIDPRGISFVTGMHNKIRNDLRKYYVKTGEDKYRNVTEGEIDDFLMHKEGVTLYEKILDTTDTYAHQITNVERGKGYGAISQKPQLFHYEEIKYPNIPILAELASYKTEEVPDAINELFEVSVANHKGKLEQAIPKDISAFLQKKRPLYVMMWNKQYKLPYEIADTTYVKKETGYKVAHNNDIRNFINGHGELFFRDKDNDYRLIPNPFAIRKKLSPIIEESPGKSHEESFPKSPPKSPKKSLWNRFTRSQKVHPAPSDEVPVKLGLFSRVRQSFKRKPSVLPIQGGRKKTRRTKS